MYETTRLERDQLKQQVQQILEGSRQSSNKKTKKQKRWFKSKGKSSSANKRKIRVQKISNFGQKLEFEEVPLSKIKHTLYDITERIAKVYLLVLQ